MAPGEHQPVASGVPGQPAAGLHEPLLQAGQRPVPIFPGRTNSRHWLRRLQAIRLNRSGTSLERAEGNSAASS